MYTDNPSPIHHKSNKINHYLKIVDYFISESCPEYFAVEPLLGSYEPDVLYKDHFNRSVCVEIQLTKISNKRMQDKIDRFVKECGITHDSKLLVLVSDFNYKLTIDPRFKLIRKPIPGEVNLSTNDPN